MTCSSTSSFYAIPVCASDPSQNLNMKPGLLPESPMEGESTSGRETSDRKSFGKFEQDEKEEDWRRWGEGDGAMNEYGKRDTLISVTSSTS